MQDNLFIKDLVGDLKPKNSIVPSQGALMGWMLFTLIVLGIAATLHSIRDDAVILVGKGSFYFELFSALTVGIVAAGSALTMRIPGAKAPLKVLATLVTVWVVALIVHSLTMVPFEWSFDLRREGGCVAAIFLFGALPALALYHLVRRGATTEPQLTLALIAIAFTAVAAAFLPLACGNDGLIHLLLGHASPLFISALMGWFAGRTLLKW